MRFVLASASPRRQELLKFIGIKPDIIISAGIDESFKTGEKPAQYVRRIAKNKALAVPMEANDVILAADTIVAVGQKILGKPVDAIQASEYLSLLSGRRHHVLTAVTVRTAQSMNERVVDSVVKFKRLTASEIDWYIKTCEWQNKAGGYAIQGAGALFIPWIRGSHSAIIGLPLTETANLLKRAGIDVCLNT